MKVRAHLLVKGRVQGVFFRESTQREAHQHHVSGWIRNLPDGDVEAVFEGEAESVEALIDFCKVGPPRARVTRSEVTWETVTDQDEAFRIR